MILEVIRTQAAVDQRKSLGQLGDLLGEIDPLTASLSMLLEESSELKRPVAAAGLGMHLLVRILSSFGVA